VRFAESARPSFLFEPFSHLIPDFLIPDCLCRVNRFKPDLDREKFKKLVMELIGIIERGHFVANPGLGDIDCEEFCDYAPVCGGASARERAKEKKDHNKDVFDIFDRLKEYE
jgi:hypothetical protein